MNLTDFKNHSIHSYITDSGFHLWACDRCCAWAQFVPRGLSLYCLAQPTKANKRDFDMIRAGKHPQFPGDRLVEVSAEQVMAYRLDQASFVVRDGSGPKGRKK